DAGGDHVESAVRGARGVNAAGDGSAASQLQAAARMRAVARLDVHAAAGCRDAGGSRVADDHLATRAGCVAGIGGRLGGSTVVRPQVDIERMRAVAADVRVEENAAD